MIDYKIFININIKNKILNIFLIIVNLQSMSLHLWVLLGILFGQNTAQQECSIIQLNVMFATCLYLPNIRPVP